MREQGVQVASRRLKQLFAGPKTLGQNTLSEIRYGVRPKADQDLDDQAFYYATEAASEVATVFVVI